VTVDIQAEVEHAAQYWASQQERSSSDVPLSLLVITESGERVVMGFADGMSDELRPQFGRVVREAVGQSVGERIEAFVSISTAWYSHRLDVRPRDDPQAGEVLVVYGANRQGQSAFRAYEMLRFGDEVRLRPLDWEMDEAYPPTFQQILEED
jgi:hypothetical protein